MKTYVALLLGVGVVGLLSEFQSTNRLNKSLVSSNALKESQEKDPLPLRALARHEIQSTYIEPEPIPADTNHKTVLVTGAAGFIGSHVAEVLLERGDSVVVIDEMNDYYSVAVKENNLQILRDHPKAVLDDNLKIFKGDICNKTLVEQIFEETKPTHICHLAARAGVRPSVEDPFIYIHSNIVGTTRLLEMARLNNVTNFVYTSSSSVYGGLSKSVFSETEQLDHPWSPYAATKKSTELIAATYNHLYNVHSTGLRFFTVYGPRGRPDMAPYKFVDRVSRCVPIQQYGDGSTSRDYTYIDDIVDGVVRAVDRAYPCEIFNLGRGDGTQLSRFIGLVEEHTAQTANIEVLPMQTGDVPYTRADTGKANRLLGYQPSVPFDEGIRKTVEWYNATLLPTADLSLCNPRQPAAAVIPESESHPEVTATAESPN